MKDELFEYHELENDPTKRIVYERAKFYNQEDPKPISYDSSYVSLYYSIINDDEITNSDDKLLKSIKPDKVKDSSYLWDYYGIRTHDIKKINKEVDSHDHYVVDKEFVDRIEICSMDKIPVMFNAEKNSKEFGGKAEILTLENVDTHKKDVLFSKIYLPVVGNKLTSCVYNHELSHVQLHSLENCGTKSILNNELVPIFIEEIFSEKIDTSYETLQKLRNLRLLGIARGLSIYLKYKNLSYLSRIEFDKYIKSSLEAMALVDIYLNSKTKRKQKEMLNDISDIFDENKTIEDMLNKYEVSMNACEKDAKILKKCIRDI